MRNQKEKALEKLRRQFLARLITPEEYAKKVFELREDRTRLAIMRGDKRYLQTDPKPQRV